jgi:hypothetical protein
MAGDRHAGGWLMPTTLPLRASGCADGRFGTNAVGSDDSVEGDARFELGDDPTWTKCIVVVPGEPMNFGYGSKEDEEASKDSWTVAHGHSTATCAVLTRPTRKCQKKVGARPIPLDTLRGAQLLDLAASSVLARHCHTRIPAHRVEEFGPRLRVVAEARRPVSALYKLPSESPVA